MAIRWHRGKSYQVCYECDELDRSGYEMCKECEEFFCNDCYDHSTGLCPHCLEKRREAETEKQVEWETFKREEEKAMFKHDQQYEEDTDD